MARLGKWNFDETEYYEESISTGNHRPIYKSINMVFVIVRLMFAKSTKGRFHGITNHKRDFFYRILHHNKHLDF